ncbi:MAG: 4Fe-4S binding protein [Lachnospiraceae bacterium]|nr:4Fe-4S binding protein [Lachnospiraceae bacterium]
MKSGKRKLVQVITAVLYNCNFTGFASGKIYKGKLKSACVPGLNCYSCPGAVSSCPLGSLQQSLVSSKYRFPYYMLGMLLLLGALLGRFICGFLCPFGLVQELLFKIPTKKIKKGKWSRALSYVKYVVLAVFVIGIPLIFAVPGFCKYICPQGILEGALPLAAANESVRGMLGKLFSFKLIIAIAILVAAVFIFRVFCRFICPLGAIYSFFNRVSVARMEVDEAKCTHCNACVRFCKMDIKKVGDAECIQCGECAGVCATCAISRKPIIGTKKDSQEEAT